MKATYSQIIRIALPIILGSLAQTSIAVADTAFLGRVGATEQAAIGFISTYYLILFMIGYSYTKGTQILAARRIGEDRPQDAGKIFDNSMVVVVGLSLVLFLLVQLLGDFSLQLLLNDEGVRQACSIFLNVRSYGLFFGYAGSVFLAFYMGIGRMRIILVGIILMSAINVFLNWIFIFGKLGFPEMGMAGAALASDIAEVVATLIFIAHSLFSRLNIKFGLFKITKLSIKLIRGISNLATPIVLQSLISLASWMLFFAFVEKRGEHDMAISSIAKIIYMVFGLPAWGFSATTNTVVSNLMGQGKQKQVAIAIRKIILLSFVVVAILSLALLIFPETFMRIYTDDPQLVADGVPVLHVCVLALWAYAVSTILYHGVVSTGSTKISLMIQVIVILFYLGFLIFIFSVPNGSLALMWTSEIFYWVMIALFTLIYFRTGHWKKVEI